MRLFWIACLLLPTAAFAASNVCEPNPQVEKAFVQNDLWNDYLEDFPREKPILARLLEKYANDVQLNRRNILVARNGIKAERYAAIEKYRLAAEKDRRVQSQYLYAVALIDTDTQKAIHMLKSLLASSPEYPWPHLTLADLYSWGHFANPQQATQEVGAFLHACPDSLNRDAMDLARKRARPN